jgi:hypothetical protein
MMSMPIPAFEESGYLPAGDHEATIDEVEVVLGSAGFRRREVMRNLREILEELWGLGVDTVWIDGSFVSSRKRPDDVDLIYVRPPNADPGQWGRLAPQNRYWLESNYGIDLWEYPSTARHGGPGGPNQTIKEFFETDMDGVPKGHILVRRPA